MKSDMAVDYSGLMQALLDGGSREITSVRVRMVMASFGVARIVMEFVRSDGSVLAAIRPPALEDGESLTVSGVHKLFTVTMSSS